MGDRSVGVSADDPSYGELMKIFHLIQVYSALGFYRWAMSETNLVGSHVPSIILRQRELLDKKRRLLNERSTSGLVGFRDYQTRSPYAWAGESRSTSHPRAAGLSKR